MSDSTTHLDDRREFTPIDGVHELRQRQATRLWYRALQVDSVVLSPIARFNSALHAVEPVQPEPEIPIADQLAEIARIAIAAGKRAEAQTVQTVESAPPEPDKSFDWRLVPANCPALMLSASPTLGGQMSEAHLAPGIRFRIESIANGVAEVFVMDDRGEPVRGYCNTVDLACADSERASGRSAYGKSRLPRSSKFKIPGLAQTFGSLR
jgi:hypothetical protein